MKNILSHFFELFFPRLCVCCQNRLTTTEQYICINCHLELPKTNHLSQANNKLEDIFAGRFPFIQIASFAYFSKEGLIQKIIHEIKYKNNPDLAIYIGTLCGKEIKKNKAFQNIDLIIPIPLHKNRLKTRGYNQSLLIAQGISKTVNRPINDSALIRKIDNPSQTKNTRLERWKNTSEIFEVVDSSIFENKHILIIDDVITTGSTIDVCAKLILECTGSRISVYCVGSTI